MTALLALASALIIGGSDFSGGLATKGDSTFRVTAVAQITGGLMAIGLVLIVGWDEVTTTDVVAGAIAGASGTFSFICFYRALASGVMSVVAPTTAVVGATIPAVVGVARGEDLGALTGIGLAIALVAIVLVSRETTGDQPATTPRSALILALTAGIGFSIFFIALAETETEAGMWPLLVARLVSVPVVCVIAWRLTQRVTPATRTSLALATYTGVTEMIANALLLVALRRGELAIASVFGSLYPVSTVLLAWIFLRERLAGSQLVGVVLALGAIALVAI